ncbi:unnamed protein product [Sphagnum balticum]
MRIVLSSPSPLFSSVSVCVQNMCAMASILVLGGIFQVNIPRLGNVLFSGYLLLCIGLIAEDEALPEGDTGEGVPSFSNSHTNR